jgi:hypothetical protein
MCNKTSPGAVKGKYLKKDLKIVQRGSVPVKKTFVVIII